MTRPLPPSPRRGFALATALLLSACTAGPDYRRPEVAVPPAYRDGAVAASADSVADLPWWSVFEDEALRGLLREAVANNQDLAIALARVAEARALVGVARSERFPRVDGNLTFSRTRSSREHVPVGSLVQSDYHATLPASWEVDLWGRVRRGQEAALADLVATEEGRRAALVTLVGDVAEAYFDLRGLDLELEVTRATRETRRETAELFRSRLEAGVSSNLETARAAADLSTASALIPDLERRIAQQENVLSLLLGRAPGPVARGAALGTVPFPPDVPAGLPCALLERRPDVRRAEAEAIAANARVGVASAERLPRLSLSALLGVESTNLADLVDGKGAVASIGAGLAAPIFDGGRLSANRRAAVARWEEAVARWRGAVQNALRDVADQLVAVRKLREVRKELESVVASYREALSLSTSRYQSGVSAYFEVLEAQRGLLPAQIELVRVQRDQYVALVRLYRALGGGWQEPTDAAVVPAAGTPRAPR